MRFMAIFIKIEKYSDRLGEQKAVSEVGTQALKTNGWHNLYNPYHPTPVCIKV
jgi:hypothetical protein